MDEHGAGSRRPRQHGHGQGTQEPDAAPDTRARAERAQADVRGQVVAADRVAEHVDLLEAGGELADDVDGLRQHRMVGVDLLRDEEEPQAQRAVPAIVASTSARISRASSSGVECQSA